MKKITVLLVTLIIGNFLVGQNLNKKIYMSKQEHEAGYIDIVAPTENKKIVVVSKEKGKMENLSIKLYDENFDQVDEKKMIVSDEVQFFKLANNHLFIMCNDVKGYNIYKINLETSLIVKTISIKEEEKYYYNKVQAYSDLLNYFYCEIWGESYLYQVNLSDGNVIPFNFAVDSKETESVYKIIPIEDSEEILVLRAKGTKKTKKFEIVIHDENGNELFVSDMSIDDKFIKTLDCAKGDQLYFIGNYDEDVNEKNKSLVDNGDKKPNHKGIYIKTSTQENPINKFYKFSDFENFSILLREYHDELNVPKFNFGLDKVLYTGKENVAIGTIYKNIHGYKDGYQIYIGKELEYILAFAFDKNGDILWDQAIHLDTKHVQPRNGIFEQLNLEHPVTAVAEGDKISLHYPLDESIYYYELVDGKITHQKETKFEKLEDAKGFRKIEDQYVTAVYWYGDYYFNFLKNYTPELDGGKENNYLYLNRIQFNK
ncbi:MAG: hypothetical protein KDD41_00515 [Flavobacteriales bacterium]|nr:hypothetical protein [Flavobacteriales bacterium]